MMRLSKMQLVLFAVVLILPALQNGALLYGAETRDCAQLNIDGGRIECTLAGFDSFDDYNPHTCMLKCNDEERLPLPWGVCSWGQVRCTTGVKNTLLEWTQTAENKKNKVINKWCGASQGK
uniref:Putative ixodes 10 kDa peptide protein n=1 Tax=Ixodes ricinus TaxID=34613 RepID=A0A0K8RI98_IXORI